MIGPVSFKIAKSTAVSKDAFVVPCVCDTFAYISGKGESTNFQTSRFRIPSDSQKLQRALPYGKLRLWCLVCVTHLHRFRKKWVAKIANSIAVGKDAVCGVVPSALVTCGEG